MSAIGKNSMTGDVLTSALGQQRTLGVRIITLAKARDTQRLVAF